MKKPTIRLKLRQRRLARYRCSERARRGSRRWAPPANRYVAPGPRIAAPKSFDLIRGGGGQVVKFLRAVARTVLDLKVPTTLDFRSTESFYPPATILLFSELDRITSLSELPKPITIKDPRQRRAREVLKQIGLHEVTGDTCHVVPEREDVVYWKATKGRNQTGDNLQILEAVANRVNRDHAERFALQGVWRGVSEAVANAVEHGYKFPRADGFSGLDQTRWWMFTQLRAGLLTVVVCDLGCGYRATIAKTLPERFINSALAALRALPRDAAAIETAMMYGRSATREANRGKGSQDALSVLEKHKGGELMILSNEGWLGYEYVRGLDRKSSHGTLGISIMGTIVWWKLPLKES